jgi:5,10-methylenetetrahydrofolate reductase
MTSLPSAAGRPVVARLVERRPLVAVELRPPQSGLPDREGMDAWIDMYHSVRRLLRRDSMVFLTDNAVGESEEENLRHLVTNLSSELSPDRIVPFLTSKHSLDYCLMYAARAVAHGFQALTVLGGDRMIGPPRCVSYAYELRKLVRERHPDLSLGGWANPYRDAAGQVDYLLRSAYTAEFYLTQIVSHHDLPQVERFVVEARRRGVALPGVFGVFFYRSGNPKTLAKLGRFFSVPAASLTREFAAGLSPEEICVKTIRALRDVGVDKVYVSNLGFREPEKRYRSLMEALGE